MLATTSKGKPHTMRWILFGCLFLSVFGIASMPHAEEKRLATKTDWAAEVKRRLVENLAVAVGSGSTGTRHPELKLIVRRNGTIAKMTIIRSSGHKSIDEAVLRMAKRTGRLPPFSRDMKGKQEEVILSIEIALGERPPPPDATSKGETVYETLGFRLELPQPFEISQTRRVGDAQIYIDIASKTNEPPPTGPDGKICTVGFDARPSERGMTQSQLNSDDVILKKITAAAGRDPSLFGKIESTMVFDHDGVRGIAAVTTPSFFEQQISERRQYQATMVRPQGTVTVSCWTTAKAMQHAISIFQKIAEGTGLAKH
ncbi:TonB family protein [Neorhizobium galegae]|uniref:TonB family C-terminal domain protein 3 n=1 Tax=Neorhizobium galegae bv. officinalis TaxID=323656 RepID=A0A0T7GEZ7_NEOGA|nr:TonB family protein [Neorhizobium galegae]CDZ45863.1 TonB family C-terminal domain protein 3 [Neorhizobium galegae bv. officinalis]